MGPDPAFLYTVLCISIRDWFFGGGLSLEKILSGDQQAAEAYMNFLKGGNSKDPIDLLADAGVDMRTPEPVKAAMEVFRRALDEMEALLG